MSKYVLKYFSNMYINIEMNRMARRKRTKG